MKNLLLGFLIFFSTEIVKGQDCEELMKLVKSRYGTTYNSPFSDVLSKVTFYKTTIDKKSYNFAIVCFKAKDSYGCTEYIYRVDFNSQMNYSRNYIESAGKAFWDYIQPHHKNLECSPDFG